MRMSEILGTTKQIQHKKRRLSLALLITGLLSLIVILVTIYGQYAGMFTISMTNEISDKGIMVSEHLDFLNPKESLAIKPLMDGYDIIESQLNMVEAESTDGQYVDPDADYIAYTFYLKNTGKETINVNYNIRMISDYKGVGVATFLKVAQSLYDPTESKFIDKTYKVFSKQIAGNDNLASEVIKTFQPGQIRKFTVYMWFDGRYTDETMTGGATKLDWVFAIATAGVGV